MSERGVVELKSPVAATGLPGSLVENGRLQVSQPLTDGDCAVLNEFLAKHPQVMLRVWHVPKSRARFDYKQLERLPALRHLWIEADAGELNDLAPLAGLPVGLKSLTLDTLAPQSDTAKDKPKKNAAVLSRLVALEALTICGQLANLDVLAPLSSLRRLGLWRCKLSSLAGVEKLGALQHLQLRAAGAKDLMPLAGLAGLKSLEVWDQRNLASLEPLSTLIGLERLWLISCGAALALPAFAPLTKLKVLLIDKLANPDNLHQIAGAPALRCLILPGSNALVKVEALAPLAGHPTLREVRLETFNEKVCKAMTDKYGWKIEYCNYPADEYLD